MTTLVTDSATLKAAIDAAQDGSVIQLAAGEYVLDKLQNLNFAHGLTITSADPAHQAVIDGLYLQGDSGLTFSDLEVKVDLRQNVGVIVQGGQRITLDGLNIHGTGVGAGLGVRLLEAGQATVSNSELHDLQGGIAAARSDDVSILNNRIHDLQIDGVQSAGSSHVTISGNSFTNFYPVAGDHSDAIQFVGTAVPAHDIAITNNTYARGLGLPNTQGILMGDEGRTAYVNVTISANDIVGATFHGISVYDVDHLDISHNLVEGFTDVTSWILVNESTNSSVTDNTTTSLNPGVGNVGLISSGNTVIAQAAIGDLSILGLSPVVEPFAPVAPPPNPITNLTPVVVPTAVAMPMHIFDGAFLF